LRLSAVGVVARAATADYTRNKIDVLWLRNHYRTARTCYMQLECPVSMHHAHHLLHHSYNYIVYESHGQSIISCEACEAMDGHIAYHSRLKMAQKCIVYNYSSLGCKYSSDFACGSRPLKSKPLRVLPVRLSVCLVRAHNEE